MGPCIKIAGMLLLKVLTSCRESLRLGVNCVKSRARRWMDVVLGSVRITSRARRQQWGRNLVWVIQKIYGSTLARRVSGELGRVARGGQLGCPSQTLVGLEVLAMLLNQARQCWVEVGVPGEGFLLGRWRLKANGCLFTIDFGDEGVRRR